jgi:flagellar biosynthetic protein FliR
MYATALAFWVPNLPPFPGDPAAALFQGVLQISFGAAIGLSAQIVVYAVAGAGEIAGLSIGLGFAELQFREATTATPVLYDIMFWAGMMGFFAAGGPEWLFAALAQSFVPGVGVPGVGAPGIGAPGVGAPIGIGAADISWHALLGLGGIIFSGAVAIAMPVLAVALAINVTVGLLSIFAPQLNVLTIGFPLLILAGLWMLAASTIYFGPDVLALMRAGLTNTAQLLHG